jgi:hypothetical protein
VVALVTLEAEVRGDTVIYDLTISRTGASAGWMNGGVLRFMAKLKPTDADAAAIFTKSTPASGIVWVDQAAVAPTATLTIDKTDWPLALPPGRGRTLVYEVEIEESNGRRETVQKGELPILGDVIQVP